MNEKMERMLAKMVDDFNRYSKLVTSGYEQSFQWCMGNMNSIEEYMVELAGLMGVELKYGWDFEVYGRGEGRYDIKYRTVEIVKEGKQRERI